MITLYVCMVCMNRSMAEPNTSQAYASTSRRRGNSVDVELQCQRFRAHITQFLNLPSYFLLNKTHKMKSKTKLDSQIISHYLDGRWFSLIDPHAHARIQPTHNLVTMKLLPKMWSESVRLHFDCDTEFQWQLLFFLGNSTENLLFFLLSKDKWTKAWFNFHFGSSSSPFLGEIQFKTYCHHLR